MKKLVLFVICAGYVVIGYSQTSITTYSALTQNFDGLANSGTGNTWTDNTTIPGWYSNKTTYNASTGSSNAGALYSFGVAGTNAITDRSLGAIASGTAGVAPLYFGWLLQNNTGSTIQSVTISYTGEQWRDGGATTPAAQTTTFQYLVGTSLSITTGSWTTVSQLGFTSPVYTNTGSGAILDGNAPANRTSITYSFNVSIPDGQQLFIRWVDNNDAGNDHALAIDDISFTPSQTLPVSLTSFTGKPSTFGAELSWATASEQNNSHFEVLRSADGKTFDKIGHVTGSNNSSQAKAYSYIDRTADAGTHYYQLKQVDFDGQFKIYGPIAVKSGLESTDGLKVYASSASVEVSLSSPSSKGAVIGLYDLNGHQLSKSAVTLTKGLNTFSLPANISQGVYFVSVKGTELSLNQKFIKQ